jgi:hypothetical protein
LHARQAVNGLVDSLLSSFEIFAMLIGSRRTSCAPRTALFDGRGGLERISYNGSVLEDPIMKHALLCCIVLLVTVVAGCGGEKPATESENTNTGTPPKVGLGHVSLADTLDQLQTPKERADQIRKWIDVKMDPKMLRPAVQKYLNDPDPDVSAAAKEASGAH